MLSYFMGCIALVRCVLVLRCGSAGVVWYLTLREERQLSVFENRVLREMVEPKREKVIGEWRRLRNE